MEIAARGWGTECRAKLPLLRHTTIHAQDHERLADFYKFVFDMKEVHRKDFPKTDTKAIYLSDGNFSIALVKNSPIETKGFQVLGFHVPSIAEIEARLKKSPPFLYPREPRVGFYGAAPIARSRSTISATGRERRRSLGRRMGSLIASLCEALGSSMLHSFKIDVLIQ